MQLALKEAKKAFEKGEIPVGAVLVQYGRVISKAHNLVETWSDSLAHAEILTMKKAQKKMKSKWLYDTVLYVTLEPCSMCSGALVLARIAKVVIGAKNDKTGACGTILNIVQEKKLNHHVDVEFGVEEKMCKELLQNFFKKRRQENRCTRSSIG